MLLIIILLILDQNRPRKFSNRGKKYFDYLIKPAQTCIYAKPVVAEEIVKIIGKFNPNKSPGHDDITNMVVKKVAPEISKSLTVHYWQIRKRVFLSSYFYGICRVEAVGLTNCNYA